MHLLMGKPPHGYKKIQCHMGVGWKSEGRGKDKFVARFI